MSGRTDGKASHSNGHVVAATSSVFKMRRLFIPSMNTVGQASFIPTQRTAKICALHLLDTKADVSTSEYFAHCHSYQEGLWPLDPEKQLYSLEAWLPWFKTEVSSSMTHLLQYLRKCFMHGLNEPSTEEFIHSLPNHVTKQQNLPCLCQSVTTKVGQFSWMEDSMAAFLFSAWKGAKS